MNPSAATDGMLSDAFSVFVSAATRLEQSYNHLHDEVARLRAQLEERNRALASSLQENARMKVLHGQILDALPCGVAVVDAQREQIVLLNPEARKLLSIRGDEAPLWQCLPEPLHSLIESGPSQSWRLGDEQQILVQADGDRWLKVRCTSIESEGVSPVDDIAFPTLILTIRDTTSQKRTDEEREASRQMMALAEISTLLAHEIRNPLGGLELFASLLAADTALSDQSKQWTRHLQAGVRSLAATVNNVLRFHTPGSSPLSPLELRQLLLDGIDFLRPLAEQSGIAIHFEEQLGTVEAMVDPGALQQLLLNLAHNAFRHTPQGGVLSFDARIDGHGEGALAVIEVSDTGRGIAPADLPHIFEPGFSGDGQSTGLGLAVCERIMSQHHGKIIAWSNSNAGATFRLEFPIL